MKISILYILMGIGSVGSGEPVDLSKIVELKVNQEPARPEAQKKKPKATNPQAEVPSQDLAQVRESAHEGTIRIFKNGELTSSPIAKDADYFCLNKTGALAPTKVGVFPPNGAEGVSLNVPEDLLFCVSGIPGLKKGAPPHYDFQSLLTEISTGLQIGKTRTSGSITINGAKYFLMATNVRKSPAGNVNYPYDFDVYVGSGSKKSKLGEFKTKYGMGPDRDSHEGPGQSLLKFEIVWSGDLDGDGSPDFYISRDSTKYAAGYDDLYIGVRSSTELITKVATQEYDYYSE
jgi:hypothetical protein